jgi:hypothetical protein
MNLRFNQKIIMSTFVTFLCLVFFYYPITTTNLSFFHSDDTLLINRVANIDSFSSFCDLLFKPFAYKIRPIANLQYLIEFLAFGHNYNLYILYNILLVTFSIFISLLIVKQFKDINATLCLLFALSISLSKFFVYSIWNIAGSFETLALILFLLIVYLLNVRGSHLRISFLCLLLILTSERYLPFIVFIPFFYNYFHTKNSLTSSLKDSIKYAFLILLLYFLFRLSINVPLIVGTNIDDVSKSFYPPLFIKNLIKATLEIFGFSPGPKYLTGIELPIWLDFSDWDFGLKKIYLWQTFIALLSIYLSLIIKNKVAKVYYFSVLLLLAASSITFRLELRWLLPCYALFMITITTFNKGSNFNYYVFFRKCSLYFLNLFLFLTVFWNIFYLIYLRKNLYFAGFLDGISFSSNI